MDLLLCYDDNSNTKVTEGNPHWTVQLFAMSTVEHAGLAEDQMLRLFNLSISGLSKEEMGFITAKLLCFPGLVTDWNSKPFLTDIKLCPTQLYCVSRST